MSQLQKIEFELLDAIPEITLIQLFMEASKQFDDELTKEEKDRAIDYFYKWYMQTRNNAS